MSVVVVIPARFASSRLPGKPLKPILDKPMIQWTWLNAQKAEADRVIVTTESPEVRDVCEAFGAEVALTGEHHQSGTERIAEVIEQFGLADDAIIVNVQGDEPMLPHQLIHQVAKALEERPDIPMATLCEPIDDIETVFDPHAVKVTRDAHDCAINFSRAPLPWSRDTFNVDTPALPDDFQYYRHIGLYAYRAGFIKQYVAWPECALERVEKLEQLRVLWHGAKILVLEAEMDAGVGVDTEADLIEVTQLMAKKKAS
jgi:3-deoxy-manno-octulosonate cytidylyltransferase (CMP-KDO synthetase)